MLYISFVLTPRHILDDHRLKPEQKFGSSGRLTNLPEPTPLSEYYANNNGIKTTSLTNSRDYFIADVKNLDNPVMQNKVLNETLDILDDHKLKPEQKFSEIKQIALKEFPRGSSYREMLKIESYHIGARLPYRDPYRIPIIYNENYKIKNFGKSSFWKVVFRVLKRAPRR